jgi:hypothetical protein
MLQGGAKAYENFPKAKPGRRFGEEKMQPSKAFVRRMNFDSHFKQPGFSTKNGSWRLAPAKHRFEPRGAMRTCCGTRRFRYKAFRTKREQEYFCDEAGQPRNTEIVSQSSDAEAG